MSDFKLFPNFVRYLNVNENNDIFQRGIQRSYTYSYTFSSN